MPSNPAPKLPIKGALSWQDVKEPLFVGIDLGMTRLAMAICSATEAPALWPLGEVAPQVPTALFFPSGDDVLWGEDAYRSLFERPERGAWLFKRRMGQETWFLEIDEHLYTAADLSRLLLRCAWRALGGFAERVEGAMIAVPAYFSDAARRATLEAARGAGWPVWGLLNEPTAAALAHHERYPTSLGRRSFVFDLGGGTLDVTLLERSAEGLRILASVGDTSLGGQDWDDALAWPVAAGFQRRYGWDPLDEPGAFEHLRRACQKAREQLSFQEETLLFFSYEDMAFSLPLERGFLEMHTASLLSRCEEVCVSACREAKIEPAEVDEVLLAGGGAKMPMVQGLLSSLFSAELDTRLDPAGVVALGAALHARSLAALPSSSRFGGNERFLPGRRVQDVNTHPLGILILRDGHPFNRLLIPRNQPLPAEVVERGLTTALDAQEHIDIFLLQGEEGRPTPGSLLQTFRIGPLPALSAGDLRIEMTFRYSVDGLVQVEAQLAASRTPLQVDILDGHEQLERILRPLPRDILLAIDCSASMQGRPLLEAKLAIREFLGRLDPAGLRLGLLSFGDPGAHLRVGLLSDTLLIKAYLAQLKAAGTTPLAQAIELAQEELCRPRRDNEEAERWLILLTDGIPDDTYAAEKAALSAKKQGIQIITLGLGKELDAGFLARAICSHPSMFRSVGEPIALSHHFTSLATELSGGAGALTRFVFSTTSSSPSASS
ncbi:MAG: Hsp70 family protein [Myxococcales bacterium]|nr:Hsp70 family protein [Myxococcales bacterium]